MPGTPCAIYTACAPDYDSGMFRSLLIGVATCLTPASVLMAQQDEIPDVEPDKPWVAIVIALVLILLAAVTSTLTPRRTHQD